MKEKREIFFFSSQLQCTVVMKLKKIAIAPLLDGGFLCFGGTKIAIQLFSSTAVSVLISPLEICSTYSLFRLRGREGSRVKLTQNQSIFNQPYSTSPTYPPFPLNPNRPLIFSVILGFDGFCHILLGIRTIEELSPYILGAIIILQV